jgi:hypothetical protein
MARKGLVVRVSDRIEGVRHVFLRRVGSGLPMRPTLHRLERQVGGARLVDDGPQTSEPVFVATFTIHALRGAAVIVVEPAEYGDGLDATMHLRRSSDGLLLGEPLMRARPAVEAREFGDEISQVLLVQNEDVIGELASQCAGEAFREGVHVRRVDRDPDDARIDGGQGAHEARAKTSSHDHRPAPAVPSRRKWRCAPAARTTRR